jgi:hypothetical protein
VRYSLRGAAVVAFATLTLSSVSSVAGAQDSDPLARMTPSTRYAYELIIDSALKAGLPIERLESKALQGIARGATDRRILDAVRAESRALREARAALGERATNDELGAAASAIRIGIRPAELSQLSRARTGQVTVPLVVLVDLVSRSVPRDTAFNTIFTLYQGGARDEDFNGLWRSVERDIVSGTDPGAALLNRARQIPPRVTPPGTPPSGRPDPSENPDR